jgi:hypothetical protein
MGILNFGKRMALGTGRAAEKTLTRLGTSKVALTGIGLAAFGLGVANKAGPAARDAAMDISMGDPNADAAFLGKKMSARYLAGSAIGGGLGGVMRASSPKDYFTEHPFGMPGPAGAVNPVTGAIGGAAGMGVGAMGGAMVGSMFGKAGETAGGVIGGALGAVAGGVIGAGGGNIPAEAIVGGGAAAAGVGGIVGAGVGSSVGGAIGKSVGMGFAGKVVGGLAGAGLGAGAGAGAVVAGATAPVRNYMRDNQQFFSESPYSKGSSSLATAQALNASGDIVLGMHNSRRGY